MPTLTKHQPTGRPVCLVLEPTRELADQVAEAFEHYGKHTGHKIALLYGGVGYGKQVEALEEGADIVVATPGRLLDLHARGTLDLRNVKTLILDEVDRMLDMGFLPDVRKIVNFCPPGQRQTLFFSATMPPAIETFAKWCLKDPIEVEIARRAVAATVTHAFYPVSMDQRDELLLAILKETDFHSVMLFTRTRKEANTLAILLEKEGHANVAVMHSDIRQADRMKALKGFKEGIYDVLVATDVAARGIDISGVSHVINYRVPENAEDYVHRIGRTGRAEAEGDAFTLLTADEIEFAESVERFIDQKVKRRKLEGFNYTYTALLDDAPAKSVLRKRRPAPKRRRRK